MFGSTGQFQEELYAVLEADIVQRKKDVCDT
jgi:hypothetical protein